MIQNKNLIYVLALIAGIIILWKFYLEKTVKYSFNSIEEINEDPLIIVGGQVAPKLKKIIGHIEYLSLIHI